MSATFSREFWETKKSFENGRTGSVEIKSSEITFCCQIGEYRTSIMNF